MNSIIDALNLAKRAHEGQTRKDGSPYIYHPMRVFNLVALTGNPTEDMLCAAVLHDVREDCPVKYWNEICSSFNYNIVHFVNQLTNQYTKELYPKLNRAERKKKELERIAYICPEAKLIKCCDRYDNLQDLINQPDKDYAKLYLHESKALLDTLRQGCDFNVWTMLRYCIEQKEHELGCYDTLRQTKAKAVQA